MRLERYTTLLLSVATAALVGGGLVYVIDRPVQHIYLLPELFSTYSGHHALLGTAGQNLLSLLCVCLHFIHLCFLHARQQNRFKDLCSLVCR